MTLMNIPMMPEAMEQTAPTRKATPVLKPSSTPLIGVSATAAVSKIEMRMPTATAPTTARTPMVTYWRRMNATAPS